MDFPGIGRVSPERPYERRSFELELRVEDGGEEPLIVGHASMFNTRYTLWEYGGWRFEEQVAPGAFKKTIKEADVRALWNHDPNIVLGRNKAGTLKLWEDERGLAYEIKAPTTDTVRDLVLAPMRRGDVSQSSFGFQVVKESIEENQEEHYTLRTIKEVRLWDVSPVTFPASPTTDAAVRAALEGTGIDIDEITSTLFRARAGLPLSCADGACLRSAIAALEAVGRADGQSEEEPGEQGSRPMGEPPLGTHLDGRTQNAHSLSVAMRQRELELYGAFAG